MSKKKTELRDIEKDELFEYAKELSTYKENGPKRNLAIFKILSGYRVTIEQLKISKIGKIITEILKNKNFTCDEEKSLYDAVLAFFNICKNLDKTYSKEKQNQKNSDAKEKNTNNNNDIKSTKEDDQISQEPLNDNTNNNNNNSKKDERKEEEEPQEKIYFKNNNIQEEIDEMKDIPYLEPVVRNKTLELFKAAFFADRSVKETKEYRINALVIRIESEIFKKHKSIDSKDYREDVRYLKQFLTANAELRQKLINQEITPMHFAHADQKTLLSKKTQEKLEVHAKSIFESKRTDWNAQNIKEGMYQCKKCKSKRTSLHQQQTRSADEPMTTFVVCADCGATQKF